MERMKQLELRFEQVREFAEGGWRVFSGNYLTCSLFVVAELPPPQGRTGPFCEALVLDTGSPVTFVRETTLRRVLDVSLDQVALEEQEFRRRPTPNGSVERAKILQGLEFPSLGVTLPRALARSAEEPFGLPGTDFLEMFRMEFNPAERRAVLTLPDG